MEILAIGNFALLVLQVLILSVSLGLLMRLIRMTDMLERKAGRK